MSENNAPRSLEQILQALDQRQPISWSEFVIAANRTCSDTFHQEYPRFLAVLIMSRFIGVGELLDETKKALFYGKDLEEVTEKHKAVFKRDSFSEAEKQWPENVDRNLIHAILGQATEAVELIECLVKGLQDGFLDPVNLAEEEGDGDWYRHLYYLNAGNIEERQQIIWRMTIKKLRERFPEKFTSDDAINRDIPKERQVMEASLFDNAEPDGLSKEIKLDLQATMEPDVATAKAALKQFAEVERQMQAAHEDLMTEAQQYLNLLELHHVLPAEILKLDMPLILKLQLERRYKSSNEN